jgi:hypothetical protein
MGVMMWLLRRGQRVAPAPNALPAAAAARSGRAALCDQCFDWRIVSGLAAVALAIWLLVPGVLVPALLVLVALACPLSMLLMMPTTRKHGPVQVPGQPHEWKAPASEVPRV